ncbi:hypothetical protein JTE90_003391 [Oedothorax gibbosus]|uniref:Uncharacterized protein n=1 Tax=Oedothorax gibbosus TaxID=931172 RepID=A0AAV6TXI8_9ARAC|nr:hypothetical protein JTE90_003391 [Oedothorax gibbosus]
MTLQKFTYGFCHSLMSIFQSKIQAIERQDNSIIEVMKFLEETLAAHTYCIDYLTKWIEPLSEFSVFNWMHLYSAPEWEKVEKGVEYLREKGVQIDIKLFDEVANLPKYVSQYTTTKENADLPIHKKWSSTANLNKHIKSRHPHKLKDLEKVKASNLDSRKKRCIEETDQSGGRMTLKMGKWNSFSVSLLQMLRF